MNACVNHFAKDVVLQNHDSDLRYILVELEESMRVREKIFHDSSFISPILDLR